MTRTHVMLSTQQLQWLEREVKRLGLKSISELLRRIIDAAKEPRR